MRKPKLRELKEAVLAVIRGPYTTDFPAKPHEPPEGFRGRPRYNEQDCIGYRACEQVCPALAIKVEDKLEGPGGKRTFTLSYDKCIFCGQCALNCSTKTGIEMTREFDLSTFDRSSLKHTIEHELVVCDSCNAVVGARKHLLWVARRLGAKAYANPTLIVLADGSMQLAEPFAADRPEPLARNEMMRVLCPDCRRTVVVRELWGE